VLEGLQIRHDYRLTVKEFPLEVVPSLRDLLHLSAFSRPEASRHRKSLQHRILSPLRGWFRSHFLTQGLRPGLHSCAASRLKLGPKQITYRSADALRFNHAPLLLQFRCATQTLHGLE
jgi:hypothetical protein